ncbi:MAG: SMC-Scp complex subunit ScpB [Myxococcales bacterium]
MTTEAERNGEVPREPAGTAPDAVEGSSEAAEAPPDDEQELRQAAQTELSLLAEAARFATPERVSAAVEALLFAADKPLDLAALRESTQFDEEKLKEALVALQQKHAPGTGGTVLLDLGGRWQLRTDPQLAPYVRRMLQVKPMRLTRAALETLAIVAYRQPVTRPEMEDLRGVDCGAVTKALLDRKLIRILGKKDEPGRPLLFGTTREFLELFNLRDLTQLPTLREFQELSEESRKIVEEEAPAPPVAGLTDLAQDPQAAEKLAQHTAESDAALSQLEDAMDAAEERTKAAAQVLAPPPPPAPAPEGTAPGESTAESSGSRPPPAASPDSKD